MANMLKFNGDSDTTETERFVRMFDQFFDCLNVRSPNEHVTKRKPYLKPYTSGTDESIWSLDNFFSRYNPLECTSCCNFCNFCS